MFSLKFHIPKQQMNNNSKYNQIKEEPQQNNLSFEIPQLHVVTRTRGRCESNTRTVSPTAMMRTPPLWRDRFGRDEISSSSGGDEASTRGPATMREKGRWRRWWCATSMVVGEDKEREWKSRESGDLPVERSGGKVHGVTALGFW